MRIAHVSATFPPYQGGTGNVCFHNARELASRGHIIHVFTAAIQTPGQEAWMGIHVHRLRPWLRLGNAPLLPQLLTQVRGFDVIHLHYPFFGGELAAAAARATRTPLVVTYHQDVLLSSWMGAVEKILRTTVGRMALRSAARLLFTSLDYGQASHIQALLKGREERIGELPNGVDTSLFTPGLPPDGLRARLGLAPSDRVALLVAGLDRAHYFKGVGVFLRALADLPEHVKGVIVGDGDLRADYVAEAQRSGLATRVCFAGRVADADLPNYYRLAGVSVLPSLTMGEAFGLVLVESLACATPVIASRLPGVRTVVADGEDGYLVEPGDAGGLSERIGALLGDPPRAREMGQRGCERVNAVYAWPKVVDRLEELYTTVLAQLKHHAA